MASPESARNYQDQMNYNRNHNNSHNNDDSDIESHCDYMPFNYTLRRVPEVIPYPLVPKEDDDIIVDDEKDEDLILDPPSIRDEGVIYHHDNPEDELAIPRQYDEDEVIPDGASIQRYAVDRILMVRWNQDDYKHEALIDWTGYGPAHRSWTPFTEGCQEKLKHHYLLE